LFQDLTPDSSLSYEQYWAFKKRRISNETILASEMGYDQSRVSKFLANWMTKIESPSYLQLDSSFARIHATLTQLRQNADLHVCTDRQKRQPVLDQLADFNLLKFFKQVMVTEQRHSKESMIAMHVADIRMQDWMVGDTGKDVETGKVLKIKTCAVLSGFLSIESLRYYNPDLIIDSVADFCV
jgi:phosphoglycolate phosphatase